MQGPSLDAGGTTAHPDPLHRAQRAGNPGQHWPLGAGFWLVFPKGNGNLLPTHDFLQDTNSSCKRGMEQRLLWRPGAQSKKRKLRCWDAVYPLPLKHHNTKVLVLRDVPRKSPAASSLCCSQTSLCCWLGSTSHARACAGHPGYSLWKQHLAPFGFSLCRKLQRRLKGLSWPW